MKKRIKWRVIALVVFFAISTAVVIRLLPQESISRFTLRFANYIRYTLPRLPHDYFWLAVAGLLVSPGKGFFVYPIDPKDNNDRVFVINPAVNSVKLQKFNSEEFQIQVYENS